jgi:hypothetical protein
MVVGTGVVELWNANRQSLHTMMGITGSLPQLELFK